MSSYRLTMTTLMMQYSALDAISKDAWSLIVTTFETTEKLRSQSAVTSKVTDVTFNVSLSGRRKTHSGVRAYAAEIGKGEVSVTEWTKAASVYVFLSRTSETNELHSKTYHLYEISKAPQSSRRYS